MSRNMICFCFEYTEEDIEKDIEINGKSTILERIIKEKQQGGCNCAEKNPKGR